MVNVQSAEHRLGLIVIPLDQRRAAALAVRPPVQAGDVIGAAARGADPASGKAVDQLFVADVNVHHGVDVGKAGKRLRLRHGAGEAVEHVALPAILLREPLADDVNDDGIRHKRTGVNVGFGSQTGRRLFLDGAAKNIARGDLRDAKLLAHANSLGALARTRRAEKNHVHAQVPHADPVINPGSPCDDA